MYKCEVCGREIDRMFIKGHLLCHKHYKQIKKYGHPLDDNPRTTYDPNDYTIFGPITFIRLYDKDAEYIDTATIDTEDLDKVKDIKWKKSNSGYAQNTPKTGDSKHMHRIIMGVTDPNLYVDHINHDKMDNRKSNLRTVNKAQNAMNSDLYKAGYGKAGNRWNAQIKLNQYTVHLGTFDYENQAAFVRWCAEQIVFGDYAFPKPMPFVSQEDYERLKWYTLETLNNKLPSYNFAMNPRI